MRFASLGSGSEGNGLLVQVGSTTLLLDCGFGLADAGRRMRRLGVDPDNLDAIVVTHEHDDHVGGVPRLARKWGIPVYLTYGTYVATGMDRFDGVTVNIMDSHAVVAVGDIEVRPFPVPHDAREPSQFVFSDGATTLGVLTDTGVATTHIEAMLSEVDALVLECNHDLDMLMNSTYPRSLKQRISGRLGHLDNTTAARILGAVKHAGLQHVIAAHLSQQNNTPELARLALATALGCGEDWIGAATQGDGFDWRDIT